MMSLLRQMRTLMRRSSLRNKNTDKTKSMKMMTRKKSTKELKESQPRSSNKAKRMMIIKKTSSLRLRQKRGRDVNYEFHLNL